MSERSEGPINRRDFLGSAAATSVLAIGCIGCASSGAPSGSAAGEAGVAGGMPNTAAGIDDNIYTRLLGVRPHLGAHEHISRLSGGRMPPEVMTAMIEANEYFVDINELNAAAGKRAAELLGAEAAHVTCGGFSGLLLGAAACLTGTDHERLEALPHPTWAKREVLVQTAQKFDYDRAYRAAGATVVYANTRDELVAAITDRTAMIAGLSNVERHGVFAPPLDARRAPPPSPGLVKAEELIAIGKKAGVPVLIDMASDMPPWDNLQRFLKAGADLVVLSGGKTIGGPQATGLLLGRRDLVEAARLNASPNDNIGRGMKVGKEEIIGLIVALERFVKQDHVAEAERWAARARRVVEQLQGIPGLTAEVALNTSRYADVALSWDEGQIPLDRAAFLQKLASGSPRIQLEMGSQDRGTKRWHATARTRLLRDGEELLVARRLRTIFEARA